MLCDWLICPAVPARHGGLFNLGEFLFALLVMRHFIANFDAEFASLWIKKYRRICICMKKRIGRTSIGSRKK